MSDDSKTVDTEKKHTKSPVVLSIMLTWYIASAVSLLIFDNNVLWFGFICGGTSIYLFAMYKDWKNTKEDKQQSEESHVNT